MTDFDPKRRELLKVTVVSGAGLAAAPLLPQAAMSATEQSANSMTTEVGNMSPTSNVTLRVNAGVAARLFTQIPPAAVTGVRLCAAAVLLALAGPRGLWSSLAGTARRRAWRECLRWSCRR